MTLRNNEKKNAHRGGTGFNVLKSFLAIALMGILAAISMPYFNNAPNGNMIPPAASAAAPTAPQAPAVVGHVVANADLAIGREYIGRVEPIQTVLLKPRISGQIDSVHFKEGSIVKEGDMLFTIDSATYQATVALRKADLSKAQASLSRAVKYYDRLKSADKRSVSASDLDMAASDVQQDRAAVEQAKAALKLAQIDLDYAKMKSPITGRIGRTEATKGNYVSPSGDPLATIMQTDPIRISFAMPDRDYMDQISSFKSAGSVYDTTLILADGTRYASRGERDFEDNTMDVMTGTITLRLKFENKNGELIPGSMVKVITKPKASHVSPVVPQEAIMSDTNGDYVYVIGEGDVAHRRDVELGVEIGTSREILGGLSAGDKIISSGLHNVRPEVPVKPNYPSTDASTKTPADLARESGYDLPAVTSGEGIN
jgi:RND family efflux transporter MFP subunit